MFEANKQIEDENTAKHQKCVIFIGVHLYRKVSKIKLEKKKEGQTYLKSFQQPWMQLIRSTLFFPQCSSIININQFGFLHLQELIVEFLKAVDIFKIIDERMQSGALNLIMLNSNK